MKNKTTVEAFDDLSKAIKKLYWEFLKTFKIIKLIKVCLNFLTK